MKCYQGAPSAPRRTAKSGRRLISSPVVPTLERLNTAALRESVRTFRDTVREHAHGLNRHVEVRTREQGLEALAHQRLVVGEGDAGRAHAGIADVCHPWSVMTTHPARATYVAS